MSYLSISCTGIIVPGFLQCFFTAYTTMIITTTIARKTANTPRMAPIIAEVPPSPLDGSVFEMLDVIEGLLADP